MCALTLDAVPGAVREFPTYLEAVVTLGTRCSRCRPLPAPGSRGRGGICGRFSQSAGDLSRPSQTGLNPVLKWPKENQVWGRGSGTELLG